MARSGLVKRQLLCDRREEFTDILGRLCRGLKKEQPGFSSIRFGIRNGDCPLVRLLSDQIKLVTSQRNDYVLVCLPLQLLDPRLGLVEGRLWICC